MKKIRILGFIIVLFLPLALAGCFSGISKETRKSMVALVQTDIKYIDITKAGIEEQAEKTRKILEKHFEILLENQKNNKEDLTKEFIAGIREAYFASNKMTEENFIKIIEEFVQIDEIQDKITLNITLAELEARHELEIDKERLLRNLSVHKKTSELLVQYLEKEGRGIGPFIKNLIESFKSE